MKISQDLLISFICTLIVFAISFIIPSQINGFPKGGLNFEMSNLIESNYAGSIFQIRYNNPVFRSRPIILETQRLLNEFLNIPFQLSFNILNFLFLFILFLTISKCKFKTSSREPRILKFVVLFSLPILFAFLGSMNTYDDILQYVFILFFLIHLFKENHLISILFFILASITRETSFLFYIVIISFLLLEVKTNKLIKSAIWLFPIIVYLCFLKIYLPTDTLLDSQDFLVNRRFYAWQSNFMNMNRFRESTTILFIMTFPFLFLIFKKYNNQVGANSKSWCKIAAFLVIANAVIVSITGLISEVRLLFIPLLFVYPFTQTELKELLFNLGIKIMRGISWKSFLLSSVLAFMWYSPKSHGTGYLLKLYIFIFLLIVFEMYFSRIKIASKE